MTTAEKIEQLIEKYKKLLSEVPQKIDAMDAWFAAAFVMIIEDLQSLQDTTEEIIKDSKQKEVDEEERDTMDIHSQIWDMVIVTKKTALNWTDDDKDKVKSKLKIWKVYTIKRIEIYSWLTDVWLNDVDGIFNSVNFQNYSG